MQSRLIQLRAEVVHLSRGFLGDLSDPMQFRLGMVSADRGYEHMRDGLGKMAVFDRETPRLPGKDAQSSEHAAVQNKWDGDAAGYAERCQNGITESVFGGQILQDYRANDVDSVARYGFGRIEHGAFNNGLGPSSTGVDLNLQGPTIGFNLHDPIEFGIEYLAYQGHGIHHQFRQGRMRVCPAPKSQYSRALTS
jgi:hypothetical protein